MRIQDRKNVEELQNNMTTELVEVFERAEDRERREYSENGCDWAYFVVRVLQGRRRLEIQPSEIISTRLYARADGLEKRALEMICATDNEMTPSPEDKRRLLERDHWLDEYLSGRNIGHADLVNQIQNIPAKVAERERFDRTYFKKVYKQPRLFSFLWVA
jgi:hypothetical protein